MRTIMVELFDDGLSLSNDTLGRAGEKNVVQFSINFDAFRDTGLTTATLLYQPRNSPVLAMPSVDIPATGRLISQVPDWAMSMFGVTQVQLQLTGEGVETRSYIWHMRVERSLINYGDKPTPVQDWLEEITDTIEKAEALTGLKIIDFYPTFDELVVSVTNPNPGDAYATGNVPPYDVYVYGETSGWVNIGPMNVGGGTGTGGGGVIFIPSVSPVGTLSWENNGDLPNPEPVNLMGPRGAKGDKGDTGARGAEGLATVPRLSPLMDADTGKSIGYTLEWQLTTRPSAPSGSFIRHGVSPTVVVDSIDGGHRVTVTDADGPKSFDVLDGKDGVGGGSVDVDATLTVAGAAADAAETGKRLGELSEEMSTLLGGDSTESVEDIELVATVGKYAKWVDGDAGQQGGESSVSWAQHSQFIPVAPDEVLRITCRCANACPGVVFYSTNIMSTSTAVGCALENPGTGETTGSVNRHLYTDADVVVPAGAAYAILNNTDAYAGWKCQKVTASADSGIVALEKSLATAEYEIEQLERRVLAAEKYNDFAWGTFDKAYFVFVHDDSRAFIETAFKAFHAKGVPLSSAAIAPYLGNTHGGKTVKEWLDLIVADGGEVLCHYSYDLKETAPDSVWYKYVVEAKQEFEQNGFGIRGLILAGSSDVNSAKGEKFCRRYFDYADKVGTSTRYNLGRKLMLNWTSLDAFKERIDSCAQAPGIYAFGFHGDRDDEKWITEESLMEMIDYITAKGNCEITTYGAVFDSIGTTVLEKRIAALETGG